MRLLKENYEDLPELKKLPRYLKKFLSKPEVQEALKDFNIESLYNLYVVYIRDNWVGDLSILTRLLNTLNIDPLNYLDYVPDYFLCGSEIKSITIPSHIKSIGHNAFCECSSLTSITIPDNVTSIGGSAFLKCSSLKNITLPSSITNIDRETFAECSGLTSIIIPDSVMSIGDYAFFRCSNLKSIKIPNSVMSIGEQAFYSCAGLTNVIIPDSVTSIGYDAFGYCGMLTQIKYTGTIYQWSKIHFKDEWNKDSPIETIHCVDGDIVL